MKNRIQQNMKDTVKRLSICSMLLILIVLTGNETVGQVNSYSPVNNNLKGENPFLDASRFNTEAANSQGKGLNFPRTDLTRWRFQASKLDGTNFPTAFDGMIVYNTGTGETLPDEGIVVTVDSGFYYFYNPTATDDISNGRWVRLKDGRKDIDTHLDRFEILKDSLLVPYVNGVALDTVILPVRRISSGPATPDHDFYKRGTSTAPTTINDNVYTGGSLMMGNSRGRSDGGSYCYRPWAGFYDGSFVGGLPPLNNETLPFVHELPIASNCGFAGGTNSIVWFTNPFGIAFGKDNIASVYSFSIGILTSPQKWDNYYNGERSLFRRTIGANLALGYKNKVNCSELHVLGGAGYALGYKSRINAIYIPTEGFDHEENPIILGKIPPRDLHSHNVNIAISIGNNNRMYDGSDNNILMGLNNLSHKSGTEESVSILGDSIHLYFGSDSYTWAIMLGYGIDNRGEPYTGSIIISLLDSPLERRFIRQHLIAVYGLDVGIGTVDPLDKLHVVGTAVTTTDPGGGSVWQNYSDRRSKENIRPYTKGLSYLKQLNPVSYNYKSSLGWGTNTQVGLVAQEVEHTLPSMISTRSEAYSLKDFKTMDTNELIYILINSVKTLKSNNEDKQKRIERIRTENEQIRQQLKKINQLIGMN